MGHEHFPAARSSALQLAWLVFPLSCDPLVKSVHMASAPLPMPQVAILPSFDGSKISHLYLLPLLVSTVYCTPL